MSALAALGSAIDHLALKPDLKAELLQAATLVSRAGQDLESKDCMIRSILQTTVDGIITIDERGLVETYNPAAEKIFGYPAAEVIGRKINMLMPQPFAAEHDRYIKRYCETGEAKVIGIGRETLGRHKDGRVFPIDLSVSEMTVGGRRLFTGVVRDISDRKAIERALKEEQDFVSAIFETVGALIVVMDTEGRVLRFNRTCERVSGYTADELRNRSFWDFLLAPEEMASVRHVYQQLVDGVYPVEHENYWVAKDGRKRRIAWNNNVLLDEEGKTAYIIGTGLDITEKKQAEEALVSVSENERKLIGQELHDALGQEMTGITLLASALKNRLAQQNRKETGEAEDIVKLSQTALSHIRRLAHGLYPTELERHGLSAALEELSETQRRIHGIRCTFQGIEQGEPVDRSTQLHLYRIAQEASNNAIKHGRPKEINITYYSDDSLLKLSIEDDGIGIPDFQPDQQEGLGLTIMRYRAMQIDADITIGRRSRGGTRVQCIMNRGPANTGQTTSGRINE